MIRAALVSCVFLCFVLLLVVLQPDEDSRAALVDEEVAVTRSVTEFETYADLTDSLTLLNETLIAQPEIATIPAPPAPEPLEEAAVAEPEVITPAAGVDTSAQAAGLEQMIVRALSQGQSEAYIDALVNHAVARGDVAVPDSLLTADGKVDTAALLSVLQISGLAAGIDETYVVRPGDSLKAISYRFFGSTAHANDIFDANRDILPSPAQLSAGLEIVIPAR